MFRNILLKILNRNLNSEFDLIIEPDKTTRDFFLELIRYRELFFFMAWRDIIVRYKQTVIGIAWSVIKPLLSMIVFTVVFGRIAKLPNDGVPYPVLVFSALLPWQYFANAMQNSSEALIRAEAMISKVYFPRLILPTSSVLVSVIDFLISLVLMCFLMLIYRFLPSVNIILLPIFFIPATLAALGVGYLFSAIGVKYRDFRHIMPFIIQFGMYISPVGFSSSIIPDRWRFLYSLNPMVGVIDGFRWCIQGSPMYVPGFFISLMISFLLFYYGLKFFRRTERSFADFI